VLAPAALLAQEGEAAVDEDSLDDVQELFSVFTQVCGV
jgi:hypothetical protein